MGDTMLLWRKPYERSADSDPWSIRTVVPLEDGSLFVWKTGPGARPNRQVLLASAQQPDRTLRTFQPDPDPTPVAGSDDWVYKHGVFWPRDTDPCFKGSWLGQRRVAFVFRCTRPKKWYQTAFPNREVLEPAEPA